MADPHNPEDPDETAADMDALTDDSLELASDEPDDDSYVWDAAPEPEARPTPADSRAGSRSGSSAGSRTGSPISSRSGSGMSAASGTRAADPSGTRAGDDPSDDTRAVNRQAAEALGLGWMDDDELRDLSPSMRGYGEEELLILKKQRTSEVKKQLRSAGGQFVIGLVVGLVTVGAIILGATNWRNNAFLIPAIVITPFGAWYTITRWKRWLGSAPYFYRLMTSLGEDAENLRVDHAMKQLKKASKQMKKHQNR